MDCTADLLLVFVRDVTASGTARSKPENKHSVPFPMLLLAVPGSLVPYKSEENQFHPVLASLGTGAQMFLGTYCVKIPGKEGQKYL